MDDTTHETSTVLPAQSPVPATTLRIVIEPTAAREALLAALDRARDQLAASLTDIAYDAVQQAFFTHQVHRRALWSDQPSGG